MLGSFFKKKAGLGKPAVEKYSTLGVRKNGTISIDTLPFVMNDDYILMVSPGAGALRVTDIGETTILGTPAYRFYLKNVVEGTEYFLQIVEDSGELVSVLFFSQVDEYNPQSEDDWNDVTEQLNSNDDYFLDNDDDPIDYTPQWAGLVSHEETIHPNDGDDYNISHRTQFFERQITEDLTEKLLVAIEDDGDEVCVRTYVGIELESADITVV